MRTGHVCNYQQQYAAASRTNIQFRLDISMNDFPPQRVTESHRARRILLWKATIDMETEKAVSDFLSDTCECSAKAVQRIPVDQHLTLNGCSLLRVE
jgi:hypothetical protein